MKKEFHLGNKVIVTHGDQKIVGVYNHPKKDEYYSEKGKRVKIYEGDRIERPMDGTAIAGLEDNPDTNIF